LWLATHLPDKLVYKVLLRALAEFNVEHRLPVVPDLMNPRRMLLCDVMFTRVLTLWRERAGGENEEDRRC
jgi:hypothetical protein